MGLVERVWDALEAEARRKPVRKRKSAARRKPARKPARKSAKKPARKKKPALTPYQLRKRRTLLRIRKLNREWEARFSSPRERREYEAKMIAGMVKDLTGARGGADPFPDLPMSVTQISADRVGVSWPDGRYEEMSLDDLKKAPISAAPRSTSAPSAPSAPARRETGGAGRFGGVSYGERPPTHPSLFSREKTMKDDELIEKVYGALKAEARRKKSKKRCARYIYGDGPGHYTEKVTCGPRWRKDWKKGGPGRPAHKRGGKSPEHKVGGYGPGKNPAFETVKAEARRKRERINPSGKKGKSRYILRRPDGTIRTNVSASRSGKADRRKTAKGFVGKGLGHLGDTVKKGASFLGLEKKSKGGR